MREKGERISEKRGRGRERVGEWREEGGKKGGKER